MGGAMIIPLNKTTWNEKNFQGRPKLKKGFPKILLFMHN
jgi:hypothetical protein